MFSNTTFNELLKPLRGRIFRSSVKRHSSDKYSKGFSSWNHIVAMLHCQFSGCESLRGTCDSYNHHSYNHYHLGTGAICRSTLSYANNNRSSGVFCDILRQLIPLARSRVLKQESKDVLHIIDASPIPLTGKLLEACGSDNGRINGCKLHIEYDTGCDIPVYYEVTNATTNDITIGKKMPVTKGGIYVFDLAYTDYDWWSELMNKHQCTLVTRIKSNAPYIIEKEALFNNKNGVIADRIVRLSSRKAKNKLDRPMRLITVALDNDDPRLKPNKKGNRKKRPEVINIISNDMESSSEHIANLYRRRWEIELFFRWIKQHLKIKRFIGNSENAMVIQIITAIIAFILLRIFQQSGNTSMSMHQCAIMVRTTLFCRKETEYYYFKKRRTKQIHINQNQLILLV